MPPSGSSPPSPSRAERIGLLGLALSGSSLVFVIDRASYDPLLAKAVFAFPLLAAAAALAGPGASFPRASALTWGLAFHAWIVVGAAGNGRLALWNRPLLVEFAVFSAALLVARSRLAERRDLVARGLAGAGALAAAAALVVAALPASRRLPNDPFSPDRFAGLAGHPTHLASLLAISIPFMVATAGLGSRAWRIASGTAAATALVALVGTAGRGAMLGLAAGGVAAIWGGRSRRTGGSGSQEEEGSSFAIPPALPAIGALAGLAMAVVVRQLFLRGVGDRWLLWRAAVGIGTDHPVLGAGWGSFAGLVPSAAARLGAPFPLIRVEEFAHGEPFQTFAEGGAVGLLLLAAIAVTALRAAARSARLSGSPLDRAFFASAVVVVVDASVSTGFRVPHVAIAYWLLLGFASSAPAGATPRGRRGGTAFRLAAAAAAILLTAGGLRWTRSDRALNAAILDLDAGRPDRSAPPLARLAGEPDARPEAGYYCGLSFMELARKERQPPLLESAIDCLESSRRIQSDLAGSSLRLAQCRSVLGDREEARDLVVHAARLHPDDPEVAAWVAALAPERAPAPSPRP